MIRETRTAASLSGPLAGLLARLLAGLLAALATGPVLASPCSEAIAALRERVRDQAAQAISASTGSQAIAAAREGRGITDAEGGPPVREAVPPDKSAQAGEGGDKAQQAKVALDEAGTLDGKGDAAGCAAAVARARRQLDAAP